MSTKCAICGKDIGFFDREFKCRGCGKICCADCVKEIDFRGNYSTYGVHVPNYEISFTKFSRVACPSCAAKHEGVNASISSAQTWSHTVELFSKNYLGRIPKASNCTEYSIETNWYSDRDRAEQELRSIAKFKNCDLVYNVRYEKDTRSESTGKNNKGTHYYTVFKGVGTATKRR